MRILSIEGGGGSDSSRDFAYLNSLHIYNLLRAVENDGEGSTQTAQKSVLCYDHSRK